MIEGCSSACQGGNDDCTTCAGLGALELEIKEAEENLKLLHRKLQQKKISINFAHSPIFERFPNEVMSNIFLTCNERHRRPHRYYEAHDFEMYKNTSVPIKLGEVRKLWREIALSTPHLWTQIYICLDNHRHQSKSLSALQDILSRSKHFPLEIGIFFESPSHSVHFPPDKRNLYASILSTLASHSQRWRSLDVFLPSLLINYIFDSISDLCELQLLHVHRSDARYSELEWSHKTLQAKSLTLVNLSPTKLNIRWDIVTHVVAKEFTTENAVQLIMLASSLESYELTHLDEEIAIEGNLPQIENVNIEFLSYDSTNMVDDYENIFAFSTFPSLTKLVYNTWKRSREIYLLQCMETSFTFFLTHLQISRAYFDSWYLIALFEAIPSITHLQLSPEPHDHAFDDYEINAFFKRLAERKDPNGRMILPSLQSFEYKSSWEFPWHLVSGFFGEPNSASDEYLRPLKHFKLVNSSDFLGDFAIPKDTLIHLVELRRKGFHIMYEGCEYRKEDLFQASLEFHNLPL